MLLPETGKQQPTNAAAGHLIGHLQPAAVAESPCGEGATIR